MSVQPTGVSQNIDQDARLAVDCAGQLEPSRTPRWMRSSVPPLLRPTGDSQKAGSGGTFNMRPKERTGDSQNADLDARFVFHPHWPTGVPQKAGVFDIHQTCIQRSELGTPRTPIWTRVSLFRSHRPTGVSQKAGVGETFISAPKKRTGASQNAALGDRFGLPPHFGKPGIPRRLISVDHPTLHPRV